VWHGKPVSVILPTYNERDSIYRAVQEFFDTGLVDEVVVVNNNAAPGTSEEVARTAAREIMEPRQGYGYAIQRGLREARGHYLVISEPDGTFLARDITKLLAFADDVDIVYGSRTIWGFIWRGANMGFFLRWGNWAVAKMMEFLFNSVSLSDVGCTMRLIRKPALDVIAPHFTIGGSAFGPEMMLLSLAHRLRIVQIPVNYLPRVGTSAVTGDIRKAIWLGLWMISLILRFRLTHRSRARVALDAAEVQSRG
jgi:glycosyltransferase involved in cell wall biosynthesis